MADEKDDNLIVDPTALEQDADTEPDDSAAAPTIERSPSEQEPSHESDLGDSDIPRELPLLVIRDAVAFPGTIMPLGVEREKSKRLIESAVRGNKLIGVVAQIREDTEDPGLNDLYRVGTAGTILKMFTLSDGTLNVIVHGLSRIGIERLVQTDPFIVGQVNTHEDGRETSAEIEALVHNARQLANRVIELSPNIPDEARDVLENIDTAGGVADFLAANLSMNTTQRQELLETFDVRERLEKVNTALTEQVDMLELSSKLQSQVREQIDQSQRRYFLQEQLKAIQEELGESDSRTAEIEELKQRLDKAHMPEEARKEADRELTRLERLPQASPEYSVAMDYLNWMCELPWATQTEDQLDLKRAEKILDEDHYDLEKVKKRIVEYLAVLKLNPEGRSPILCFLGPPGVGKTSLGQSIARALGRNFIRISLGGMHDEAQLRGHRRTYIGAMPGRIIQEVRKSGSRNPVFMLDEVDKIGQDFRGDPASALLEILDPQQNHSFSDNYLDVPFDLSSVMFIATANYSDPIPAALKDRMETISLSGYTIREKLFIAKRYLVPRQLKENGLLKKDLVFDDQALTEIATSYTREAGVRHLEREIGTVARGVAAKKAKRKSKQIKITADKVSDYLGPPRFGYEVAQATSVPGVVTGLAYTATGGEILFVEAARMPGNGRLTLTGQLGDVMRESAQAAFSIARSRAQEFKIDEEMMNKSDLHVHVPAGAIPKDGPSAGVAMLTAIISLMTGRPCRSDIAMTGEITLTGRVLPIGGVKEKVLAAHRAGISRVILPADNQKDIVDIPPDVRKKMKFTYTQRIDKVLKTALEKAEAGQSGAGGSQRASGKTSSSRRKKAAEAG